MKKDDIAARALDQGPYRRAAALADDEIAFPVPWYSAVFDLGWALADQDHVLEPARARSLDPHVRTSLRALRPQAGGELLSKRPAGLNEERLVDRFVRHAHAQVVRIITDELGCDLLRRPEHAE